jgi:NAD(P)H-hydrate epimerase
VKILTAAQMREVDRRTAAERGIPSLILMENAGARVFELLAHRFGPLARHRVAVVCGKGNNGGDGLVVARQLYTRGRCGGLSVVLAASPGELQGDAAANYQMLAGVGCPIKVAPHETAWETALAEISGATLLVDALLGTGLRGPAEGLYLRIIQDLSTRFAPEQVVAVDIPSGFGQGPSLRAGHTITFTAPKVEQILLPDCAAMGELHVVPIGSPPSLYEDDPGIWLETIDAAWIAPLFAARRRDAHKGDFGHVLIVAGSTPKPGAAILAGTAALRAGAGLVTVATAARAAGVIPAHTPELMTEPLPETELGTVSPAAFDYQRFESVIARKDVMAIGPGVGTNDQTREFIRKAIALYRGKLVLDADALTLDNVRPGAVLTPHPGEMARLLGCSTAEVQSRRVEAAREFARARAVCLVLKGFRTLVATPDGRVLVNLTGTPAMASGGSGDVLTGMIAAFLAQFAQAPVEQVVAAAVFLHGRAGELAAREQGQQAAIATDLLRQLGAAIASLRDA